MPSLVRVKVRVRVGVGVRVRVGVVFKLMVGIQGRGRVWVRLTLLRVVLALPKASRIGLQSMILLVRSWPRLGLGLGFGWG